MSMRAVYFLSILLVLPFAQSSAEQAYTWTDQNGTRHFSEDPPHDGSITAAQIELLPAPSAGNIGGDNDFYSVINQADRMEKKRLANEKLIAARLQAEAEARKAAAAAQTPPPSTETNKTQEYSNFFPGYPQQVNSGPRPVPGNKPYLDKPVAPKQLPTYKPRTSFGE